MTEPQGRMVKMGRRGLLAHPGRMVRTVMREHLDKMGKMGRMGKMGKMVLQVVRGLLDRPDHQGPMPR